MSTHPGPLAELRHPPEARFLASRAVSGSTVAWFCKGETLEEMRKCLQQTRQAGRYHVYDRRPAARGIDVELVGVFLVDDGGTIEWRPLPSP